MSLRNLKGVSKTLFSQTNYSEYLIKDREGTYRLKQYFLAADSGELLKDFERNMRNLVDLPVPFASAGSVEVYAYSSEARGEQRVLRVTIENYYCTLQDEILRRKSNKLPFSIREVLEVTEKARLALEFLYDTATIEQIDALGGLEFRFAESIVVLPDFTVNVSPLAGLTLEKLQRHTNYQEKRAQLLKEANQQAYEIILQVIFSGFDEKDYEKLLREKQNVFEIEINPILTALVEWLDAGEATNLILPKTATQPDELSKVTQPLEQEVQDTPSKHPTTLKILNDATFKDFCASIGVKDFYNLPTETQSRFPRQFSKDHLETLVIELVDLSAFVLFDIFNLQWPKLNKLALRACGISNSSIDVLLSTKSFNQMTSLDFSSDVKSRNTLDYQGIGKLVQSPLLSNLKELVLRSCRVSTFGIIHISESPYLTNLEKLDLGEDISLKPEAFLAINNSPHLSKLKELVIVSIHLGDIMVQALLLEGDKSQPKSYEKLTMVDCKLTTTSIYVIFASNYCLDLKILQLDGNDFSDPKLQTIYPDKPLKAHKIQELSMASSHLFADVFLQMINHLDLTVMKDLDLNGNTELFKHSTAKSFSGIMSVERVNLTNSGVNELSLLELSTFNKKKRVSKLNLTRNAISPLGIELLACSSPFENLQELQIWDQDDNLMSKFLSTENAKHLKELFLVFNRLSHRGMVLWRSHNLYLNNLISIDLSFNKVGKSGIRVLTNSDKFQNLRKLVARFSDLDDGSLRMIENSECLPNLRDIRVTRGFITFSGLRHFLHSIKFRQLEIVDLGEFKKDELLIKREILKSLLRKTTRHVQIFYSFNQ